jgi:hypothetical protein
MLKKIATAGAVIFAVAAAGTVLTSPPNTLHPFCTYELTYRLTAVIEIDGERHAADVVRQHSFPRDWTIGLLKGSCRQTHGMSLSFRLKDERVVLMTSDICVQALQAFADRPGPVRSTYRAAMREQRRIDIAQHCHGLTTSRWPTHNGWDFPRWQGYVIDNAHHPTHWSIFSLEESIQGSESRIHLVSAIAQAVDASPTDSLRRVAPGLLKTQFRDGRWPHSPEWLIPSSRRSNAYVAQRH